MTNVLVNFLGDGRSICLFPVPPPPWLCVVMLDTDAALRVVQRPTKTLLALGTTFTTSSEILECQCSKVDYLPGGPGGLPRLAVRPRLTLAEFEVRDGLCIMV
jgi:hypothetical protein